MAIELAYERNWKKVWLEKNSLIVVNAFANVSLISWRIRTRCVNCL